MWLARALAERDLRPAARQPPALGRLARRARRPAADPRLPRRRRRGGAADPRPDSRHRPRHEPRVGDDGRLRGGQGRHERARRRRPRRPAGQDRRAGRLPDAHQPEHARAVRHEHRRDHRDRPRGRRDPLLRRRQPERDHGPLAARATWASTSSTSTSTSRSASRTAAAGPGAGPIAVSERIEPFLPVPRIERSRVGERRTTAHGRTPASSSAAPTSTRSRSAACAASRATSASSSAPTPTSSASAATASPRRRRPPS